MGTQKHCTWHIQLLNNGIMVQHVNYEKNKQYHIYIKYNKKSSSYKNSEYPFMKSILWLHKRDQ